MRSTLRAYHFSSTISDQDVQAHNCIKSREYPLAELKLRLRALHATYLTVVKQM